MKNQSLNHIIKKLRFVLLVTLTFASLAKCTDSELGVGETEQFYVNKLVQDESFRGFVNMTRNLKLLEKRETSSLIEMQNDLNNVSSQADFYSKINKHYVNTELVVKYIEEINQLSMRFKANNSDFLKLNQNEQEIILISAGVRINEFDKSSNVAGKVGQCETQMTSDKESCFQYALVGGAFCGLLSPTILGALACYASVMAADTVCHNQAEKNYEICKNFSTVNPA